MKIKSNEIISKIHQLKKQPVLISGYVMEDTNSKDEIRVYPELDNSVFYVLNQKNIIDISNPNNDKEKSNLIVTGDCEIKIVKTKFIHASDLHLKRTTKCGCDSLNRKCKCKDEDPKIVFIARDRLREAVLSIGYGLANIGVKLKCSGLGANSVSKECCKAYNNLADSVGTINESEAAREVEAMCYGVG